MQEWSCDVSDDGVCVGMRDVASMGGGEYLSALSLEETGEVGDR